MPQMHLPMFPHGVTHITPELAVQKREGQVTYFNGHMPIFLHEEHDVRTFRMITAKFCVNGNATQMEIVRAFGVPAISVKRAVQRYRTHGPSGFYAAAPTARGGGADRAGVGEGAGAVGYGKGRGRRRHGAGHQSQHLG